MKAAIYCRVSTEEQGRPEHVSLDTQAAECHNYAEARDWEVVSTYQDVQSGLDASRPQYQELLAAARDGQVEIILAYHPYRFGRDAGEAISCCRELERLGVQVQTVKQDIGDPFVRGLMFLVGEKQSRDTSEQVRDNMRRLASQGKWVSRPPIGYDVVKRTGEPGGVLVPNDDAHLVGRLFEMYASGDASIGDLQQEAARLGLRINGHVIDRQRIDMILRNPAYMGKVVYGRLSNGKFTGRRKQEDFIEADGLHTAIVDKATWDAVQRRLAFNREHHTAPKQTDYLLTSFVYCGHCGGRMYGQRLKRKSGALYYYYRCQNGVEYRTCDKRYVSGPRVDQAARDALAGLLPQVTPSARESAKKLVLHVAAEQMVAERKELGRLRAQREKQIRKLKKLTDQYVSQRIPAEVYDEMVAEAKETLARIDADLEQAQRPDTADGYAKTVEAIWGLMERVPWPPAADNLKAWRKVVESSVERVEVFSKDDVRVDLSAVAQASKRSVNRPTKGGPPCARPRGPG